MAGKLKILCVEDDEDALFITSLSLGLDENIATSLSRGAGEALGILQGREEHFDCIILDAKLPDLSGADLLTAIRELDDYRQTPIIFLTGSVRKADADVYRSLGALAMIAKPFDPLTLAAEVRGIITGS
ncbi:response regulator [Sphingomonas sp. BIUV-7]|uniref:Response regulator n=1 Tax=Sphingomonas natans TaxID=3063330 RepID=A0ABT8Y9B2_9SPHN|nr:response regulator [Sphingomonas sp. BIUV-7]MDO6414922.1 response regulator [Sphingomonas sp. BIUV-7]